jgi:tRNA pseudouridine55 synthase
LKKAIPKIIVVDKKEGETPLMVLERFRAKNSKYKDISITYAGRLDPMASGVLVLLAGEEIKNKEKYLAFDKEYEFEVLFGFATDTYDILGKIILPQRKRLRGTELKREIVKNIKNNLKYFTGHFTQKYPMYSSKTVAGKPLFAYARGGQEVKVPEREVNVKKLELIKIRKITAKKLLENIEKRIQKVTGDFRQKEIIKIWQKNLNVQPSGLNKYFIASFKIKCSSGTYVRGIANSLGEKIGIPALAYRIKRIKVGRYS